MGVQELKAQEPDLAGRFEEIAGMKGYFHCAEKKGYSGVGLYTRHEPSEVIVGLGHAEFDAEGRYVELRFDTAKHKRSLISCYFPSGSSSEERQAAKFRFLDIIYPHLAAFTYKKSNQEAREFILVGDVNIAHQNADLKNWRGNMKNSGFLPQERAWMTQVIEEMGLIDVYRRLHPDATDACYTWWSNRGQAYAHNVGWRIDYHLATAGLGATAQRADIYKGQRFSDHAPLTIDYDFAL